MLRLCCRPDDLGGWGAWHTDIFRWRLEERYDVVFFSAWFSLGPPKRFEPFWTLVADCLDEHGRMFLITSCRPSPRTRNRFRAPAARAVERLLLSGGRQRTVKVFYEFEALRRRLVEPGWIFKPQTVNWRLSYAAGHRGARGRCEALRGHHLAWRARRPATRGWLVNRRT